MYMEDVENDGEIEEIKIAEIISISEILGDDVYYAIHVLVIVYGFMVLMLDIFRSIKTH